MSNTTLETPAPDAAARPSEPSHPKEKTAPAAQPATKRKATRQAARKSAPSRKKSPRQPAVERSSKKAAVIALMKRAKGATLAEIEAATGWEKHTIRGFVSILGHQGGEKIESSKNTAGERVYKMVP